MATSASPANDVLQCPVCYNSFDGTARRPWDLGCGHCFCERCLKDHPRSFRDCPECRVRTNNPHVSVTLLRLVNAQPASGNGVAQGQPQQRQQPEQQQRHQPPMVPRPAARRTDAVTASTSGQFQPALPQHPAPGFGNLLQPSSGHIASHQQQLATFKSSIWAYATPILGLLYMLSPLDIIPDIIPIIGWMDDLLVLMYVVWTVWGMMSAQSHSNQRDDDRGDPPHRNWPR